MRQAFVAGGANLGDRLRTLTGALAALREASGVSRVVASPIFETDPVGLTDQPAFLNLVAAVETELSPEQLLSTLQQIEQTFGRERHVRWGPRTLDLDLLAFEGETRATAELELPHPRMFERGFVMVPLGELLRSGRGFDEERWGWLRAAVNSCGPFGGVRPFEPAPPS